MSSPAKTTKAVPPESASVEEIESATVVENAARTGGVPSSAVPGEAVEPYAEGSARSGAKLPAHQLYWDLIKLRNVCKQALSLSPAAVGESSRKSEVQLKKIERDLRARFDELRRELRDASKHQQDQIDAIQDLAAKVDASLDYFQTEIAKCRSELSQQQADQDRKRLTKRMEEIISTAEQTFHDSSCAQQFIAMHKEKTPEARDAYRRAVEQQSGALRRGDASAGDLPGPKERDDELESPTPVPIAETPSLGTVSFPIAGQAEISMTSPADLTHPANLMRQSVSRAPELPSPYARSSELESMFPCFRDAKQLHAAAANLVEACRQNWPEALACLEKVKKALELFPAQLRDIANEEAEPVARSRKGEKAAANQAQYWFTDLKNLDLLVTQKLAVPGRDMVLGAQTIGAPKHDALNIKRSVKELRDKFYAFERTFGRIEEYQIKPWANVKDCGADVDVVEIVGGDGMQTSGELYVVSVVQCGYFLRNANGHIDHQQRPKVIASRKKLPAAQ